MKAQLREKDLLAEIDRLKKIITELEKSRPYGLVWDRQRNPEQFEKDAANAVPVLKPKGGKFKDINLDPEGDHNVLIEGDNYHALSVLSYTHRGKIDVIYIDPPYNTGNKDFRYNDEYVDPDDIYRHSKWLSFMEKRLRLAHSLLSPTGVIAISINDIEQAQLKLLCEALFGADNAVACLPRITKASGKTADKIAGNHDYLLIYANNKDLMSFDGLAHLDAGFKYKDAHFDKRGLFKLNQTLDYDSLRYSVRLDYPIRLQGTTFYPGGSRDLHLARLAGRHNRADRAWRWSKELYEFGLANDFIVVKTTKTSKRIYTKTYQRATIEQSDAGDYFVQQFARTTPITSLEFLDNAYSNDNAKKDLRAVLPDVTFDYPKPLALLTTLIQTQLSKNITVLDFMAGSATTGHAVLELNKKDNGTRRVILCTDNVDSGDQHKICEDVAFERMKRVMKGYTTPAGQKVDALGGNLTYLKTDFIPKDLTVGLSDEAKLKLTRRANLLLSLKENTFTPVEATDHYEITSSPSKITAVYFREDKSELEAMLNKLLSIADSKPVTAYIFAWEKGAYKTGVPGYPFDFQDIPEPIVEVYQSIGY